MLTLKKAILSLKSTTIMQKLISKWAIMPFLIWCLFFKFFPLNMLIYSLYFIFKSKKEREKRLGTKSGDFKRLNKRSTTFLYYFIGQNHTFYLYEYTPGYKLKASVGKDTLFLLKFLNKYRKFY